jgi:C4-dicarboxylate-specific signal transduction histidine kinase
MEREKDADELTEILIVEDSPVQAEKLKYILEENGFQVMAANNGVEALAVLNDGYRPLLIISDIIMPEMGGYEFCRRIREDEKFNKTPVILLTSLSDLKDIIKGLECGANSFIVKPYDDMNLISRIQQIRSNIILRQNSKSDTGIQVYFSGATYFVTAEKLQILDFLLSTYEEAYRRNVELIRVDHELKLLNEQLENKVEERTATLTQEISERKRAEEEAKKYSAELIEKNEELRAMTQQLWQAAKLATMGELSASIAHELNNPLATVSMRAESLLTKTQQDSPMWRELKIIEQEVERMATLIANLLQFSRRSQPQISTVDICEEIEKALELIYYHLRKRNIVIWREFAKEAPHIHADRQQLRQLFLNLFTNASDAMPRGGTLTIRVTAPPESMQVIMEVADTGTGIPPEILPKVAEPFYSTKPEGEGTGLGLAICRRIVKGHNGTFDLTSEGIPGKGTTARISLPVTSGTNSASLKNQ